jgi:hypothetical protein
MTQTAKCKACVRRWQACMLATLPTASCATRAARLYIALLSSPVDQVVTLRLEAQVEVMHLTVRAVAKAIASSPRALWRCRTTRPAANVKLSRYSANAAQLHDLVVLNVSPPAHPITPATTRRVTCRRLTAPDRTAVDGRGCRTTMTRDYIQHDLRV